MVCNFIPFCNVSEYTLGLFFLAIPMDLNIVPQESKCFGQVLFINHSTPTLSFTGKVYVIDNDSNPMWAVITHAIAIIWQLISINHHSTRGQCYTCRCGLAVVCFTCNFRICRTRLAFMTPWYLEGIMCHDII